MRYVSFALLACLFACAAAPARDAESRAALALALANKDIVPHSCVCGCVETGVCKCPNCNTGCGIPIPKKAKKKTVKKKTVAKPVSDSDTLFSSGGCANGQCGQPSGFRFRR